MKKIKYIKDKKEIEQGILYEFEDFDITGRGIWTVIEQDEWDIVIPMED